MFSLVFLTLIRDRGRGRVLVPSALSVASASLISFKYSYHYVWDSLYKIYNPNVETS